MNSEKIMLSAPGNDPAHNEVVVDTTTSVTHSTGQMASASAESKSVKFEEPRFFQQVPDTPLGDFLSRLVEIGTVTIASTNTAKSLVTTIDPWALFLANPAVADKIANFSLIRGTLEFVAMSAMPGSCYGLYVWSDLINGGATDSTDVAQTLIPNNCMQVDHWTSVDCANSENTVLQLPWVWPYDFAQLPAGPAGMHALSLVCLSPIGSGLDGGIATGTFRLFARLLPGYVMSVPHFQGRKGKLQESAVAKTVLKKDEGIKVSQVAGTIGKVADVLSAIPIIAPVTEVVSVVAHGVEAISSWFGFTRESDPHAPMPVTQRSVTSLANIDGSDSSDIAALSVTNAISIDPTIVGSTPEDVLANGSLFSRWTLVNSTTWTSAQAVGTDLVSVAVTPFYGDAIAPQQVVFPVGGYVGLPFDWWRGDMEYRIIVPVSKFHRGTLQFFWVPYGSGAPTAVTNTTLNYVADVSTNIDHQFTVGYARDAPYLYKNFVTSDVTIVQDGFSNGSLRVRVINPLVSQSATASVQVLIFARAGKNMDFAMPSVSIAYPDSEGYVYTNLYNGLVTMQGALGDDGSPEDTTFPLVPSSGSYPGSEILWGENVSSVRSLMQKPSRIWYGSDVLQPQGSFNVPPLGVLANSALGSTNLKSVFNWAGWYRVMFTGIAASERYKMLPRNTCFLGAAPATTQFSHTKNSTVSMLAPMTFCGANRGAEFLLPYYEAVKFLFGRRAYTLTTTDRYNVLYFEPANSIDDDPQPEVVLYHSFGPDIRVTCFRQVPKVQFANGSFTITNFWWQYAVV